MPDTFLCVGTEYPIDIQNRIRYVLEQHGAGSQGEFTKEWRRLFHRGMLAANSETLILRESSQKAVPGSG